MKGDATILTGTFPYTEIVKTSGSTSVLSSTGGGRPSLRFVGLSTRGRVRGVSGHFSVIFSGTYVR